MKRMVARVLPVAVVLLALLAAGSSPTLAAAGPDQGWTALAAGRDDEARAFFRDRLAEEPADIRAALGLATLLEGGGDPAGAASVLAGALEAGGGGPLAAGAAVHLLAISALQPDGGASLLPLVRRLAETPDDRFPPELRDIAAAVLSDVLSRAGRGEEGLSALVDPGHRVTRWTLVGPYGRFSPLALDRSFPPEDGFLDGTPGTGASPWPPFRLETSFPDGRVLVPPAFRQVGVVYAACEVEVAEPRVLRVVAGASGSFRLFLDGREILGADRRRERPPRFLAGRVELVPGRHRFLAKLDNSLRLADFVLALHPLDGGPPLAAVAAGPAPLPPAGSRSRSLPCTLDSVTPEEGPDDPAALLAAAWWTRARGLDRVTGALLETARKTWPDSPVFAWLLGDFLRTGETGLAPEKDLARARSLLEEAVRKDPGLLRADLLLAGMDEHAGRADEALRRARKVLEARPDQVEALLLVHRVAAARGWRTEAAEALERVLALAPGREGVLDARIDFDRRFRRLDDLRDALAELHRRDPVDDDWPDFLAAAGRHEEAIAAWREMVRRRPAYLYARLALARALLDADRLREALEVLRDARRAFPREGGIPLRMAATVALLGQEDETVSLLRQALELNPARVGLWRVLARRGRDDPFVGWLVDPEEVLRDVPTPEPGTDASLLADIAVVKVHPDGSQTELYQGVHKVWTRKGVEQEGELEVMPGARLETLQVRKPDGRIVDVDPRAGPPFNLPGLAPGDAIVYTWRRWIPPWSPVPGALDNRSVFLFQGPDRSFQLSRYVVFHDPALPVRACGNEEGLATTDEIRGGLRVRSWTARGMDRLQPEPHVPDPLEVVPHVRLELGLSFSDLGDMIRSALVGMLRPDDPLPELAEEIRRRAAAGGDGPEPVRLARAMHRLLCERMDPGGAAFRPGVPASAAASAGEGNRAVVALALGRMLGLEARLVLARPSWMRGRNLDCPSPTLFSYPVVEILVPGGAVFLDYNGTNHPFDRLPVQLAGGDALEIPLDLDHPVRLIDLPDRPPEFLAERTAELALTGDGRVEGTLVLVLREGYADTLRSLLAEVSADDMPRVFRGLAADSFPGAEVISSRIEGADKGEEGPVTITLEIRGGTFARRIATGFALPLVLHRANLLAEYGTLPTRRQPLLLDAGIFRRDVLRVRLPEGLAPRDLPRPVSIRSPFGSLSLVARGGDGFLELRRELLVPYRRVEPGDEYRAFRSFARSVDEAEEMEVRVEVASPSLAAPGGASR